MTQNNVNLEQYSNELATNAKNASKKIRTLSAEKRAAVLARVAELLREKKPEILAANKLDLEAAAGKLDDSKMEKSLHSPTRSVAFSKAANSRTASRLAVSPYQ